VVELSGLVPLFSFDKFFFYWDSSFYILC